MTVRMAASAAPAAAAGRLRRPHAPSPLEPLRVRGRAPGPRRRSASLRAEAESPLGAPLSDAGADGARGARVHVSGPRLHGHADERVLRAGELEDEGLLLLAVRLRPRTSRGIEAVSRDRQAVVHPAGGGGRPASHEPGCCVGADPVACTRMRGLWGEEQHRRIAQARKGMREEMGSTRAKADPLPCY